MQRIMDWIQVNDIKIFNWINVKWHSRLGDLLMPLITHLGGATCTLSFLLLLITFSSGNVRIWSLEALLSLIISHLCVHLIKKKISRLRPYLHLPHRLFSQQLKDFSFPSGHTAAIFSVAVVFSLHSFTLAILFLPLASIVGLSRIYLGHHYITDVLMGALLGSATSIVIVMLNL